MHKRVPAPLSVPLGRGPFVHHFKKKPIFKGYREGGGGNDLYVRVDAKIAQEFMRHRTCQFVICCDDALRNDVAIAFLKEFYTHLHAKRKIYDRNTKEKDFAHLPPCLKGKTYSLTRLKAKGMEMGRL